MQGSIGIKRVGYGQDVWNGFYFFKTFGGDVGWLRVGQGMKKKPFNAEFIYTNFGAKHMLGGKF